MDIDSELARPDLDRRRRCLCLAVATIHAAAWPQLQAVATAARAHATRSDLEETLLQATLFFGFPRAVSAFEQLAAAWPAPAPPAGGDVPAAERTARGRELFAAIYGRNDEPVRARLCSFHREFHDFVLEAAYGRILCRPGLDVGTRELLAVTALAASDQVPQLVAHARGALTFGLSRQELREAIWCAVRDLAAVDALLRRI